jgi:hypothetical protein
MDLATVVLLVLGLLFFGGIGFLAWRERKKAVPEDKGAVSATGPSASQHQESARGKRRAG